MSWNINPIKSVSLSLNLVDGYPFLVTFRCFARIILRCHRGIQMFTDFRMQNEVARKINFLNGFVQPGSVTGRDWGWGDAAAQLAMGFSWGWEPMACWKNICWFWWFQMVFWLLKTLLGMVIAIDESQMALRRNHLQSADESFQDGFTWLPTWLPTCWVHPTGDDLLPTASEPSSGESLRRRLQHWVLGPLKICSNCLIVSFWEAYDALNSETVGQGPASWYSVHDAQRDQREAQQGPPVWCWNVSFLSIPAIHFCLEGESTTLACRCCMSPCWCLMLEVLYLYSLYIYMRTTLWLFYIAMENCPFIDGLPVKNGDLPWLC